MFDDIVVTEVINAITVFSPQGRKEKIVDRKSYALSFCIDGQITYEHKGKKYISTPDYAIILPKGETYMLYGNKKGVFPVINFDTSKELCTTHTRIPIKDVSVFMSDFEKLKALLPFKKNRAKALSIFYNIIYKLASTNSVPNILLPALNYLENNYSSPELNNSILAQQCNISEVYFRKLFLQAYKMTPRQYLIDIRLNKAKELLSEGYLKISAIAERCGFTNPYHFTRTFKEKVGVTPCEYIKESRVYKI